MIPRSATLLALVVASPAAGLALGPRASLGGRARQPLANAGDRGQPAAPRASRALAPPYSATAAPDPPVFDAAGARAAAATLALLPAAALAAGTGAFEDPSGIAQAFFFVTFVPQNFWLLLVFAPNWKWTRRIFEPLWPLCVVALAHLYIVGASAGKPPEAGTAPLELFNNLFNPVAVSERGIDVYVELGSYRNFAAEEWTHELVWDLFVGRWIWLEGRRREIFTCHSVLLTNLIGPPGLLLHALTVQLYAFFRSDDPTARWADPEALRTELDGQQRASDGGG